MAEEQSIPATTTPKKRSTSKKPSTGKKPGAGWLKRVKGKIATYGAVILVTAGTSAVLSDYLSKYVPAWAKVTPSAQVDSEDIVSRLGLQNEIEYVAVQLGGRLKRVSHDGTEMDPNFDGYIPLQPITKVIVLERQNDGSYVSKGITQGGTHVQKLKATYKPGQLPQPGTSDQVDLDGLTQIYLPAPKPAK